ncbi:MULTISPECIES: transketolase C-terminal domain-containing protein [unclassified Micromonospora]|uniref:transketolase family protein n=1 Tax=unclassified Micromonospora TaxID=2617518 RepID=UPI001C250F3F|nr:MULTISPECIES: transketolase C-terminal domain-containing protein [unclassified Micromonospora]MBU8858615.1 transketolase [Micromonospora sp. WMMB482]MDM4784259.1 transketolase C-terminal domain-containing protein [Micromonospora sp. b486]
MTTSSAHRTSTTAAGAQPADPAAGRPSRATREVYRDLLVELIKADDRLVCLDSDTGLFTPTDWGEAADRYVNLGIAEQNLLGTAAALAKSGRIPFVNTMATFAATRALEAVKVDIALNNVPVRIAATHGGLSAGHLGPTHHSLEDVAVMRLLPNLTVLVPADATNTEELLRACVDLPGPVYLRLGRGPTPDLDRDRLPAPRIGEMQHLRDGDDVTLIATGPYPVLAALTAAEVLARQGIDAAVLNAHTIKPLDQAALLRAAGTRGIVTVEEHWAAGGLGSAVAEVVGRLGVATPVLPIAVDDIFAKGTGNHRHLLERNGITPDAVVEQVRQLLDSRADDKGRRSGCGPGPSC